MTPAPSSAAYPDPLKYGRGEGPRPPARRTIRPLEWLTLLHAGGLLAGLTWGFGGGDEAMRPYFIYWGAAGIILTVVAARDREVQRHRGLRPLRWLLPLLAFNLFVAIGCLNPNFREIRDGADVFLIPTEPTPWLPSSARPALAWQALAIFDALWITAFNVAFVLRRKRAIRGLLLFAVLNALALAVLGTLQKLSAATGPYFGEVAVRQPFFFSTFVYHNHWGSFLLLMLAAAVGLTFHFTRRSDARDALHSPAFVGIVVIFLLAATAPLSGSRSCTGLAVLLLGVTLLHTLWRALQKRRRMNESAAAPILGAGVIVALALAGAWWLAEDSIRTRVRLTREQIGAIRERGGLGARSMLYEDTWRMARDRPWAGWGMGSYPHVFTRYSRQTVVDRLPVFYRDAHSDWLQALAEHGVIGSLLLAATAVSPLLGLRWRDVAGPLRAYLLFGCAIVLLYAWIEFPFGNLAVVFSWWLCFFAAVQYCRLSADATRS